MRGRVRVIAGATIAACGFSPHAVPDGGHADTIVPDVGTCEALTAECIDDFTLRTCVMVGGTAQDTPCPWGCLGPSAHCGLLVPSGGGAVSDDMLVDPALHDITDLRGTVDGANGSISGLRGSSASGALDAGIYYYLRNNIAVFRMKSIRVSDQLSVQGPYPVVFVATGTILVSGDIDAGCTNNKPGPGGFPGAAAGQTAAGSGGGSGGGGDSTLGGGGGGYGGAGGSGGRETGSAGAIPDGGKQFGGPLITVLIGGGGGGGGGHGGQPAGGGGGGGIQLVAGGSLEITPSGTITAGGCGGTNGANGDSGGGGGAGGSILLEALSLTLNGRLAVNGGGGGAGGGGTDGQDASLSRQRAAGGNGGNANGGAGGAAATFDGAVGSAGTSKGGGGGGSVGRMRFESRTGSGTVDNTQLSPALDDPSSPATLGSAHVE